MKKSIKIILAGILIVPILALSTVSQHAFAADNLDITSGAKAAKSGDSATCLFTSSSCDNGIFTTITDAALYVIGAVSVLMLIYGGIRYTISGGNEKDVTAAKNTILYAIIGIIVALLAFAIVNFVLGTLIKN